MDPIHAAEGFSFRFGFSGHSGHLRVEPLYTEERANPVKSLPDFVLPPAFPKETPESIKEHIEEKYLLPRLELDQFSPEKAGRQWDFDWFDRAKVTLEPSLPRKIVLPVWELPFRRQKKSSAEENWEPVSVEVDVSEVMVGSQEFGSAVGAAKDVLRGSTNNRPFRPGGLDDSSERFFPEGALNGDWVREVLDGGPAQKVPPTFKQGLDLGELEPYPCVWNVYEDKRSLSSTPDEKLTELSVQFDNLFQKAWEEDIVANSDSNEGNLAESGFVESKLRQSESTTSEAAADQADVTSSAETGLPMLDAILIAQSDKADSTFKSGKQGKEAWAVTEGIEGIGDRFYELVPDMALEFPFELDVFQKEAIYYLEKGESVFVAAHTSAGKTVVAEYAFALATKHCTRAVYTAPIKTISNQKYRDFCGKFDVGLLTGDVSLRPEASCLIMTTEILRSMLYRGADIIRDIEWVIFDEVHYVNDVERGVVWEEVIIMLPRHINIVLLSATVPNTIEFADWIGRTKQKKIHVTGTRKRPVPLEHCLFYSGELYKICENEIFIPQGLKAAKDAFRRKNSVPVGGGAGSHTGSSAAQDAARGLKREFSNRGKQNKHSGFQSSGTHSGTSWVGQSSGGGQNSWGSRRSMWLSLIDKLSKKSLLPVVIFSFSKNQCDKSTESIFGTDLTSSSEKSEIRVFCDKAFSRLRGSDRNLPQVIRVQSYLHRGIGVHHAGLLPIVKEVVEMLFCRGVIKVLFSTETFAMGVNAPARTVVFDTLRKFDGREFRQVLPGEYTQMAGRAGRRGLDETGTVVLMCRDEFPEESDLKHVIVGSATRLESQFRLTYIMILHLLRVEELKVEDMLKRSFAEFHSQKKIPEKEQLLLLKLAQPTKHIECIKGEPEIEEYYDVYEEAQRYHGEIAEAVMQSPTATQFLTPGRVVIVKSNRGQDHLLGVVVKAPSATNKQYLVLVLKPDVPSAGQTSSGSSNLQDKKSAGFQEGFMLLPKSKRGFDDEYFSSTASRKGTGAINLKLPHHGTAAGVSYEVREINNKELWAICSGKIKIDIVRLLEDCSNTAFSNTVQQLLKLKNGNKYPPALDPVKDLKLKDMDLVETYHKWTKLSQKLGESKCHGCIKLEENMKLARENKRHKEEVGALEYQMSNAALQQMPEFKGRINILKEIGCIDEDLVVQIKGRVACEMNSGEELICTECLFDNQLDDLEPEEAVALMSAFVFQQKNASKPSLTPKLAKARQRLYDTAMRLGQLQVHFNLPIVPEDYANENLKFGLMEVVYEWAKGTAFAEICELTDVPEGLIVRTIVRLDETCREFRNAAAIMGNSALYKKMETASNAIKRDIVFAASLYITGV